MNKHGGICRRHATDFRRKKSASSSWSTPSLPLDTKRPAIAPENTNGLFTTESHGENHRQHRKKGPSVWCANVKINGWQKSYIYGVHSTHHISTYCLTECGCKYMHKKTSVQGAAEHLQSNKAWHCAPLCKSEKHIYHISEYFIYKRLEAVTPLVTLNM